MSQVVIEVTFIFLSIIFNGLYVAAEFSLARCRVSKVESMAIKGGFLQKLLLRSINRLNDYISAAQVGITIASLVLGAFAENFFARFIGPLLTALDMPEFLLHPLSFIIAMSIATYLHVVIGEFIPKTLALQYPEQIALATILPLDWSYRITKPLVWVLNASANYFLKVAGITANNKIVLAYSEDEIKYLIKESQKEGVIEQSEEEMVNKVFDFTDTVVREVMTPRIEIIGVDSNATVADAVEVVKKEKVSKIPVFEQNIDNILGVVFSNDLLKALSENKKDAPIQDIIKPIKKVPESKPIADLLTEFKRERIQIAIVLDEFGGTDGLVTLEDIIEELVGDIQDEDELPEEPILKVEDGGYLIESRVLISDVNTHLGTEIPDEHFDTVGGFVFGLIGREPKVGDEAEFEGWIFKVEKSDERNIKQIRAVPLNPPPEPEIPSENSESEDLKTAETILNQHPLN
ncbi:MAG: hemolysin family protein [Candidatus Caenarcaniphilales bacterium]|nr:hemolysin family protein [Candidatus Caenarcaniphilales bacterium]